MTLELQSSDDPAGILTPDERLRVFVSSTLQELQDERKAVRSAIEALGLAPVMFELGARPHAPRTLYRAYLNKSHIFVGIYWKSYGWIAADETISGLEDEYQLSSNLPKLIYLKKADQRDARLEELLARVKADDRVSYKSFSTARELKALIRNDLALMLSERFESNKPKQGAANTLPWPATPMIGRQNDCTHLEELLLREEVRLVTMTGAGGIGKTRLAIGLAHELKDRFSDGVHYVTLAAITNAELVPDTIARAIGAFETERLSALDACKARLGNQNCLLVLDNFEQVLEAADIVADLLRAAPGLKVLVTSRAPLNLSGEWEYPVYPLTLPQMDHANTPEEVGEAKAVELFVSLARAIRPEFELNEDNAADIAEITRRLDGLPLAIELATARLRVLTPKALLARLENRLALLTGGYRDLPERQRTLRRTIDWSFNLLEPAERHLFASLGVFVGGFDLLAAETLCRDSIEGDVFELLQSLVDKSLIVTIDAESRFGLLETVREYAIEKLEQLEDAADIRKRHAAYFLELAASAHSHLHEPGQLEWLNNLDRDYTNIRAAIDWAQDQNDLESVAAFGSALWYYWYVRGRTSEGLAWMLRALPGASGQSARMQILLTAAVMLGRQGKHDESLSHVELALPIIRELEDTFREIVAHITIAFAFAGLSCPDQARHALENSLELAETHGPGWIVPHVLAGLARVEASQGKLDRSVDLAERARSRQPAEGDPSVASFALITLATIRLLRREIDEAERLFLEGLAFAKSTENPNLEASSVEGLFAVAMARNQTLKAATLWGTAERLRETVSVPLLQMEERIYLPLVADARLKLGEQAFTQAINEGRRPSVDCATSYLVL